MLLTNVHHLLNMLTELDWKTYKCVAVESSRMRNTSVITMMTPKCDFVLTFSSLASDFQQMFLLDQATFMTLS